MNKHLHSIRRDLEAIGEDLCGIVSNLTEESAAELHDYIGGWIAAGKRRGKRVVRAWLLRRYAGQLLAAAGLGTAAVVALVIAFRNPRR